MAQTLYPVNHPLARKTWSSDLMKQIIGKTSIMKFFGTSSNSLIQVKNELKGSGDKITFGLRALGTGTGVSGNSTLEGNEEGLTTYSDSVILDHLRHAFRTGGEIDEQRVPFNVREECREALSDWWAERLEYWFFNQLVGNTAQTDTRYTGMQSVTALDTTDKVIGGGHSTTASLGTDSTFSLRLIDLAVEKAKTRTYKMRPININGGNYYVAFLSEYQMTDLRREYSANGSFGEVFKAAMGGSNYKDNPIISGAEFVYNNVLIYSSPYLPSVVTTSAGASTGANAVLCGAQAMVAAFGKGYGQSNFSWTEESFDYGDKFGVKAGLIGGLKRTIFNSLDFGVVPITTYSVAHIG